MGKNKKAEIEYPFQSGEVINYKFDGVSIHQVTAKIKASFLNKLPETKEIAQGFHYENSYRD